MSKKSMRDLFDGEPQLGDISLGEFVDRWKTNPHTERELIREPEDDILDRIKAQLPGDDISDHGVGAAVTNPMPELGGPLDLSRALWAGQIPPEKEKAVRKFLRQYERFSGETLYNPMNHLFED